MSGEKPRPHVVMSLRANQTETTSTVLILNDYRERERDTGALKLKPKIQKQKAWCFSPVDEQTDVRQTDRQRVRRTDDGF